MRKLLQSATAFAGWLAAAPAAMAEGVGDRDMWWGPGWGYGHMMFGGLMMIVFWGGVILLIILAVRWLGGESAPRVQGPARSTALDILKERYARGEIDRQEYEERRKVLEG
jgi:putative membrane protein